MNRPAGVSVALLIMVMSLVLPVSSPVMAWDPEGNNPRLIQNVDGWWAPDNWWNYDFDDPPDEPVEGQDEHVDWPVGLVYWYRADVVGVKNLYWGNAWLDSVMWNKVNDGAGWDWHGDKGTKNYYGDVLDHLRPYGLRYWGQEYMLWHSGIEFYVVGTAHIDLWPVSGWSESSEHYLADWVKYGWGWPVDYDYYYTGNYESPRTVWDGPIGHYWDNDGYATRVEVPYWI